jgi:hypothetical protein
LSSPSPNKILGQLNAHAPLLKLTGDEDPDPGQHGPEQEKVAGAEGENSAEVGGKVEERAG